MDQPRKLTTSVLDRLYSLEIEFHRLFRGADALEAAGVHTSYALLNQYEPLIRAMCIVGQAELAKISERMKGMDDPRDVQTLYYILRQVIQVA